MPEEITVIKELGIIEVFSYGKVTREDSESSMASLEKIINETNFTKVLADTRKQESAPGTMDIFNFGELLPRSIKIAILATGEQSTAQDVKFAENVAYNRGVNIKTFTSKEKALEWLHG